LYPKNLIDVKWDDSYVRFTFQGQSEIEEVMSIVSIQLSDEQFRELQEFAQREHRTPEEVGAECIMAGLQVRESTKHRNGIPSSSKNDLQNILRHAGTVQTGYPTGLDNELIDADLAREYSGKDGD
jgi:hypothetical protein